MSKFRPDTRDCSDMNERLGKEREREKERDVNRLEGEVKKKKKSRAKARFRWGGEARRRIREKQRKNAGRRGIEGIFKLSDYPGNLFFPGGRFFAERSSCYGSISVGQD